MIILLLLIQIASNPKRMIRIKIDKAIEIAHARFSRQVYKGIINFRFNVN